MSPVSGGSAWPALLFLTCCRYSLDSARTITERRSADRTTHFVLACVPHLLHSTSFHLPFTSLPYHFLSSPHPIPLLHTLPSSPPSLPSSSQRLLVDVTPQLHVLEQVSSAEHIGSMTEALLKVLDEDGVVAKVTCMCTHVYPSIACGRRTCMFVQHTARK